MANLRDRLQRWGEELRRRERGQGLMEYGLIISVVSIAAVVLIMAMGPRVASMFSTAGSSAFPSDRRRKGNFAPVDRRAVLTRLAQLRIQTWNYLSQGSAVRHIGPMAQEFHRAFGTGEDDTAISPVDANGVALAAIQALHEQVRGQGADLTAIEARLAALEEAAPAARVACEAALSR
jgi:Flp pilus assembly pilin Flp